MGIEQPGGGAPWQAVSGGMEIDLERLDLFAFHDDDSGARWGEVRSIVTGVQLAPEPDVPSVEAAKHRKQRSRTLDNSEVDRAAHLRDREIFSSDAPQQLRPEVHGKP